MVLLYSSTISRVLDSAGETLQNKDTESQICITAIGSDSHSYPSTAVQQAVFGYPPQTLSSILLSCPGFLSIIAHL
jgi:hypothetical protein